MAAPATHRLTRRVRACTDDTEAARHEIDRYRDHEIGLADASLEVLAHRHRTNRILTLDQRHFRAMTGLDGRPFELVPIDS